MIVNECQRVVVRGRVYFVLGEMSEASALGEFAEYESSFDTTSLSVGLAPPSTSLTGGSCCFLSVRGPASWH